MIIVCNKNDFKLRGLDYILCERDPDLWFYYLWIPSYVLFFIRLVLKLIFYFDNFTWRLEIGIVLNQVSSQ